MAVSCHKENTGTDEATTAPRERAARPVLIDAAPTVKPLKKWNIPAADGPQTWIRARNVDARWLRWVLAPPRETIAISSAGPELSFAAEGPRDGIVARLDETLENFPKENTLRLANKKTFRGRKIDINAYGASVDDLMRLIADVGGINIELERGERFIDINVEGMPWDRLLDEVALAVGLNVFWLQPTLAVLATNKPPRAAAGFTKKRFDLSSRRVPVGRLLALIEETTGQHFSTETCTKMVNPLSVRRLPGFSLAQLIAFRSDIKLAPTPNRCDVPTQITSAQELGGEWQLVALARSGASVALLQRGEEFAFVRRGEDIRVGLYGVTIGDRELLLNPMPSTDKPLQSDIRALITNDNQASALLVSNNGEERQLSADSSTDPEEPNWSRKDNALTLTVDYEETTLTLP